MNNEQKFQVGDICDFDGMMVRVTKIHTEDFDYKIITKSVKRDMTFSFTLGGFFRKNDSEIALKLIERPKKKITKRFWIFDIKGLNKRVFKSQSYLDDKGRGTDLCFVYNKEALFRKHENEFIDIEVEE